MDLEGVAQDASREACASLEDGVPTRGPPDEYLKYLFIPMFCLGFISFMIEISVLMLYFLNFVIMLTIELKRVKSKKNQQIHHAIEANMGSFHLCNVLLWIPHWNGHILDSEGFP